MSVSPARQDPSEPKAPQDGGQPLQAEELPAVGYACVALHHASSRFEGIRPLGAWLLLGLLLALSLYGVSIHDQTQSLVKRAEDLNNTDFALYERIVNRIHAGEGYYQAAGSELRAGAFPLRPFLTWRLPTLASFMALFPAAGASRIAIAVLVVTALTFWIRCLKDDGTFWMQVVGGILLFISLIVFVLPPCHLYHETWSGLCVALSLALYSRGYWQVSVVSGLLALFLRELALPFVVVMLGMACWQRRKGEAIAWFLGLVGFAVFLGIHAWMVSRQLSTEDTRTGPGWLHLGGWPFVIKTARANVVFLAMPSWLTGLVLPFLLLGLAGWSGPIGSRAALVVGVYVAAFLFAGRPASHAYWGLMYSSLLPLGFVFAPRALGDLLRAIRPGRVSAPQQAQASEQVR